MYGFVSNTLDVSNKGCLFVKALAHFCRCHLIYNFQSVGSIRVELSDLLGCFGSALRLGIIEILLPVSLKGSSGIESQFVST